MKLRAKYIFSEEKGKSRFYYYQILHMDFELLAKEKQGFDVFPIRKNNTMKVKIPNAVIPTDILKSADRWTKMEFDVWVKKIAFVGTDKTSGKRIRCCSFVLTKIAEAGDIGGRD